MKPPIPPPTSAAYQQPPDLTKVLDEFLQTTKQFEASADDMVRVRVSASLQVEDVHICGGGLDAAVRQRIELAVVAAVNAALRKAVLGAGEILAKAPRRPFPGSPAT